MNRWVKALVSSQIRIHDVICLKGEDPQQVSELASDENHPVRLNANFKYGGPRGFQIRGSGFSGAKWSSWKRAYPQYIKGQKTQVWRPMFHPDIKSNPIFSKPLPLP